MVSCYVINSIGVKFSKAHNPCAVGDSIYDIIWFALSLSHNYFAEYVWLLVIDLGMVNLDCVVLVFVRFL